MKIASQNNSAFALCCKSELRFSEGKQRCQTTIRRPINYRDGILINDSGKHFVIFITYMIISLIFCNIIFLSIMIHPPPPRPFVASKYCPSYIARLNTSFSPEYHVTVNIMISNKKFNSSKSKPSAIFVFRVVRVLKKKRKSI